MKSLENFPYAGHFVDWEGELPDLDLKGTTLGPEGGVPTTEGALREATHSSKARTAEHSNCMVVHTVQAVAQKTRT